MKYISTELWRSLFRPTTETPLAISGDDLAEVNAVARTKPNNIWTVVQTEDGNAIVSGLHFVNRVGYFITEHPATPRYLTCVNDTGWLDMEIA